MHLLKINNVNYILPSNEVRKGSVLNHLDMVGKGLKTHIHLYEYNTNIKRTFNTEYINSANIEIISTSKKEMEQQRTLYYSSAFVVLFLLAFLLPLFIQFLIQLVLILLYFILFYESINKAVKKLF